MCMAVKDCKLNERVDSIDARVIVLEDEMRKLRTDCQTGFGNTQIAINNLSKDFASRMNSLDHRIVEETAKKDEREGEIRSKWHEDLRRVFRWTMATVLAGAGAAMGITMWEQFYQH